MSTGNAPASTSSADHNDLVISRLLKAPRAALWKAWTDPSLLVLWWCPKPWVTELRGFDLRPGGAFYSFMSGPDGGTSDNPGCFLEIVQQSRIAFSTAVTAGWRPAHAPWLPITAIFTMADEAGGTRYVATCLHADKDTRDRHEQMGFYEDWNVCIDQLDALAQGLSV